ncbi:MAG: endonuclease [Spirochaetales bacterium]|jgi:endonuclease/exonuclease/phosphatase family metal-dependent hydrolase|nr:endonuclease [Spirochaetales bacterium]
MKRAFTAATMNVHYVSLRNGVENWEERRESVSCLLADLGPDIAVFQEMETFGGRDKSAENLQLSWLQDQLPQYQFAAVGDPDTYPSTQPIMYRPDIFEALEQGFFFFSPQPDDIYSRPWKGGYPSFCSWVLFRFIPTDKSFYVYNVHLDFSSPSTRVSSSRLIVERISSRRNPDAPVLLLGDFNSFRTFKTIKILTDADLSVSLNRKSTFHFNIGMNLIPAIDHVLVSDELLLYSAEVVRSRYNRVWPSDHYPVISQIGFR